MDVFFHRHLSDLKLRALCATRWFIRINAIKLLYYHRDKIFYALLETSETLAEWDCATRHKVH